jgi:hypothetical protein
LYAGTVIHWDNDASSAYAHQDDDDDGVSHLDNCPEPQTEDESSAMWHLCRLVILHADKAMATLFLALVLQVRP